MATTSVTTPTLDAQGLINAAMQDLSVSQTMLAHTGFGGGFRLLTSADKPTPAAATYDKLSSSLVLLSSAPRTDAKAKPKPPSVITMNWSPITFSGFEVHGAAALSLHSDGTYSFHGQFDDPSAWDYDELAVLGRQGQQGRPIRVQSHRQHGGLV